MTAALALASTNAAAAPIPRLAPVTIATLPARSVIKRVFLLVGSIPEWSTSAAQIAASLRSPGWTGRLGFSPSEYSQPRDRRATPQADRCCPVARDVIVRFAADRLARQRGHECLKWVDSRGLKLALRTAGLGAHLAHSRASRPG